MSIDGGTPISLRSVYLNSSSGDELARFYAGTLGLVGTAGEGRARRYAAGDTTILSTTPAAVRHAPAEAASGRYHLAILLPSRLDLARVLRRVLERDVSLQGAADHGVGEALHLAGLEGNSPEVCADRTPEESPAARRRLRCTLGRSTSVG